jgi:hypothetical protein
MMQKLVKVLKAIGRFINRTIIDMAADRGGGTATREERIGGQGQDWENDLPHTDLPSQLRGFRLRFGRY